MKRTVSIVFVMMFSISIMAQFNFNPYAANQAAFNQGFGQGCFDGGNRALCKGDYDAAFKAYNSGVKYTANNWGGLGICYELGLGTERNRAEANRCYRNGANQGDKACRIALQRIAQSGYMSEEEGKEFLGMMRAAENARTQNYIGSGGGSMGTFNSGGGSSSGSTYTTCRTCGGSGTCTSCNGRRGYYVDSGMYTGSGSRTWSSCPSCNGNGRCFNCHGTGRY